MKFIKVYTYILFLFIGSIYSDVKVAGILKQDVEWTEDESPYIIISDVTIAQNYSLTIQPGVEVIFRKGVKLIVKGDIFAAGEENSKIIFRAENHKEGWGGIQIVDYGSSYGAFIDAELADIEASDVKKFEGKSKSYDKNLDYTEGSIISNCIIKDVVTIIESKEKKKISHTGAILCYNTSPYIENCIIENNNIKKGGAISCVYYSSPLITGTIIKNNYSVFGGAGINCFFFSSPVIKNNIIINNKSKDYGAGLLINSSSPKIKNNVIYGNHSEGKGGGMAILASKIVVTNNLFRDNSAKDIGAGIYVASAMLKLKNNAFLDKGLIELNVGVNDSDIVANNNYWNSNDMEAIADKIYDQEDNPILGKVKMSKISKFISGDLPFSPTGIKNLKLKYDRNYEMDLAVDLSQDYPLYIQIEAEGGLDCIKDIVQVHIKSSKSNLIGFDVNLLETDFDSGIYRGEAIVKKWNNQEKNQIKAKVGEKITIAAVLNKAEKYSFTVLDKIPYVTAMHLLNEKNKNRIISHNPTFGWDYLDIRMKPQKKFRIQIGTDNDWKNAEVYDSNDKTGSQKKYKVTNINLIDGKKYFYRIKVHNGSKWSGYLENSFKMNSVASITKPISPLQDVILKERITKFKIEKAVDPDADSIAYVFEIANNRSFSDIFEVSTQISDNIWKNSKKFVDNKEYYWRSKVFDGYEDNDFMQTGTFWVNYIEQNPNPTQLSYPENNTVINNTNPVLSWENTSDPDPKSELYYIVTYAKDKHFKTSVVKSKKISATSFEVKNELKNNIPYYWRVIAYDQTKRKSISKTFSFKVDTKPSIPLASTNNEELKLNERIAWENSIDPQENDVLKYTLQISKATNFSNPIVIEKNISTTQKYLSKLKNIKSLKDNQKYYYRVKATDNHRVSSAYSNSKSFIFNKFNNPPLTVKSGFSLANNKTIKNLTPVISFNSATDPDFSDRSENLHYKIELSTNKDFKKNKVQAIGESGENKIAVKNISDDMKWYYRIITVDDEGAISKPSKTLSFITNVEESAPSKPKMTAPKNNFETYKMSKIIFKWNRSFDPDWGNTVSYNLIYSSKKDFSNKQTIKNLKKELYILKSKLKNNTTYYWYVEALDNKGNKSTADTQSFTVNSTPSIPNIYKPSNGKEKTLFDQIVWKKATDPDPKDIVSYTVEISAYHDFSVIASKTTKITDKNSLIGRMIKKLNSKKLKDNIIYYWRVKAVDNRGNASDFSDIDNFFFNRVNNAPKIVENSLSPANNEIISDNRKIKFSWEVTDSDLSDTKANIATQIQISKTTSFKAPLYDLAINQGNISYTKKLSDNKIYYWRIRAIDNDKAKSKWSKVESFILNTKDDAPKKFSLQNPIKATTTYKLELKFSWTKSFDIDPNSSIKYLFELAKDNNFNSIVESKTLTETKTKSSKFENNTTYYWRVTAIDDTGLKTECKKIFSFTVNSTPSIPTLNGKNGKEVNIYKGASLSWTKSIDPNPKDKLIYELEISDSKTFSDILYTNSKIVKLSFNLKKIKGNSNFIDNNEYFIRVRAKDNHGFYSDYSKSWSGFFNLKNQNPSKVNTSLPNNSDILKTVKPVIKWDAATDPDVGDNENNIKYVIEISKTNSFKKTAYRFKADYGITSYKTGSLSDNSKLYYRIKAIDNEGASSEWSDVKSFYINSKEDEPDNFKLNSPRGTIKNPNKLKFNWEKSKDQDLYSSITYVLYYGTDKKFSNAKTTSIVDIKTNSYQLETKLAKGTYYWRVKAIDNTGLTKWSRAYKSFKIK